MDNFLEEVVVKRNKTANSLLYGLSWVFMVLFGLIALMGFSSLMNGQFGVFNIVVFLICGGVTFLIFRYKDELRSEYEYTFTNGELDIARVLGNSRRRYLTALSLKNVEAAGEVTHQSFQRYLSMKDVKKHNWFLNRDSDLIYFYFVKNNIKHVVVVEPSQEMRGLIRKYLGFGIWQG